MSFRPHVFTPLLAQTPPTIYNFMALFIGILGGSVIKNSACKAGDTNPGSERSPEKWQSTPEFVPEKILMVRRLAAYNLWSCKS